MQIQDPLELLASMYSRKTAIDEIQQSLGKGLYPDEEAFTSRFFSPPGRMLDIGCGTGREAFAFAARGFEVTGTDISGAMVAQAKRNLKKSGAAKPGAKPKVDFVHTNGIDLPFPDDSFDYVFAIGQVLGFIAPRKGRLQFLREIRRVLKPRGIALLDAQNSTVLSDSFDAALRVVYPFIETGYNWPRVRGVRDYARFCLKASFFKWWLVLRRDIAANAKRSIMMCLQGGGYGGLEPGDFIIEDRKRGGEPMLVHKHSRSEAMDELRTAGLEILDCKSRTEVIAAPFGSAIFSPFMSSHYFAARK